MISKSIAAAVIVALVEARFGQERCPALEAIQAVTSGGQPGQAATIAGGAISDLLAAANPCQQLQTADEIVATLGDGQDAIDAAQQFLNCEKNFNDFNQATPVICSDPALPTTEALRGIVGKVDPNVIGADQANQLAASSLANPLDATGKSIADLFAENGFTNFTTQDSAGAQGAAPGGNNAGGNAAGDANGNAGNAGNDDANAGGDDQSAEDACVVEEDDNQNNNNNNNQNDNQNDNQNNQQNNNNNNNNNNNQQQDNQNNNQNANAGAAGASTSLGQGTITNTVSSIAGADFGACNPGMKFASGVNGRKAEEFTFQAADPKIEAVQQEALNFNIITNRICDEMTNQCNANDAAKTLCEQAQQQVTNLGRVRSTADEWNTLLGFAGQDTNPENTPTQGEPTE